jgi:hypothetical protein
MASGNGGIDLVATAGPVRRCSRALAFMRALNADKHDPAPMPRSKSAKAYRIVK